MATQTPTRKLDQEVLFLQKDTENIKRVLFFTSHDLEGEYKPSFIKKVLKRISSLGPSYEFTTKKDFLNHVRISK